MCWPPGPSCTFTVFTFGPRTACQEGRTAPPGSDKFIKGTDRLSGACVTCPKTMYE
jgi:hypothetical protein